MLVLAFKFFDEKFVIFGQWLPLFELILGFPFARRQFRARVKMAGWIKPAGLRRQLINGILQMNINLISCFRANMSTGRKMLRHKQGLRSAQIRPGATDIVERLRGSINEIIAALKAQS